MGKVNRRMVNQAIEIHWKRLKLQKVCLPRFSFLQLVGKNKNYLQFRIYDLLKLNKFITFKDSSGYYINSG